MNSAHILYPVGLENAQRYNWDRTRARGCSAQKHMHAHIQKKGWSRPVPTPPHQHINRRCEPDNARSFLFSVVWLVLVLSDIEGKQMHKKNSKEGNRPSPRAGQQVTAVYLVLRNGCPSRESCPSIITRYALQHRQQQYYYKQSYYIPVPGIRYVGTWYNSTVQVPRYPSGTVNNKHFIINNMTAIP